MVGKSKEHNNSILVRTSLAQFHGMEAVSIVCRKDKIQGVVSFRNNFFLTRNNSTL